MSLGYCKNGAHDCSYPSRGHWCWGCTKDDEAEHKRATEWATMEAENKRLQAAVVEYADNLLYAMKKAQELENKITYLQKCGNKCKYGCFCECCNCDCHFEGIGR